MNQKSWYIITALLVALGLGGCSGLTSGDDGPPVVRPVESRDQAGNTHAAGESGAYVGQEITLAGPVRRVYADGLFSVATTTSTIELGESAEVLVVAPNAQVVEGEVVEVSGVIRIFGVDEAAEIAGSLIPAEEALSLQGRLIIVADELSASGG